MKMQRPEKSPWKNQESHSLMKQSRRLQLLLCPAFPKRIQGKTVTPPSSPRGARKRNQCSSPLTSRKFHWTHIYSLYIYIGSVYMKSEESSDGRCPAQFITTFFRLWICMTLVLFWGWWCSNQLPKPHQWGPKYRQKLTWVDQQIPSTSRGSTAGYLDGRRHLVPWHGPGCPEGTTMDWIFWAPLSVGRSLGKI